MGLSFATVGWAVVVAASRIERERQRVASRGLAFIFSLAENGSAVAAGASSFKSAAQKGKGPSRGLKVRELRDKNDTNIMIIGYDNRVTNCENPKSPSPSTGIECLTVCGVQFSTVQF